MSLSKEQILEILANKDNSPSAELIEKLCHMALRAVTLEALSDEELLEKVYACKKAMPGDADIGALYFSGYRAAEARLLGSINKTEVKFHDVVKFEIPNEDTHSVPKKGFYTFPTAGHYQIKDKNGSRIITVKAGESMSLPIGFEVQFLGAGKDE